MKKSLIIAALVAVGVTGWIVSGQFGADGIVTKLLAGNGAQHSVEMQIASTPAADIAAAKPADQDVALTQVRVREIFAEEWVNELVLSGRTEAERIVELRTETTGRVIKRGVAKGDRVEKGTVLLQLAMNDRQARLNQAKATLAHAELAFEAATKLSKKAFRSVVQVAQAKATLESAKSTLATIRIDVNKTVLRAPFAGIVDELPLEIGDYATLGTIAAKVIDLDPILVVGDVAERDVTRVKIGAAADVRLVNGEMMKGEVRYISRLGASATRTFRVEVALANPNAMLAEGLTAELRLQVGRTQAHRVSPAVLTLSDKGVIGIKALGDGDTVVFHPVSIIADTEDGIWLAGLPEHVTLISVGQEFVRVGQRVIAISEGEAPQDGNS